jgi:hypothetical protein
MLLTTVALFAHANFLRADFISNITANLNGTAIPGGDYIWFNSAMKLTGSAPNTPFNIYLENGSIQFTAGTTNYNLSVPNAVITFNNSVTQATTTFNSATQTWQTTLPTGLAGNNFLAGFALPVPTSGIPAGVQNVKWTEGFSASTNGVNLNWQWAAAAYTSFSSNLTTLGIKPVDDNSASQYQNSDHAGTPENFTTFVTGGATGGGGSNYTGSYSGTAAVSPSVVPEPSSICLLGIGATLTMGGIAFRRQRRGK